MTVRAETGAHPSASTCLAPQTLADSPAHKAPVAAAIAAQYFQNHQIQEALHHYCQALAQGEPPLLHAGERWTCHMLLGNFEAAWQDGDNSDVPPPKIGRRPLIRCLRGFGDAIQFLRYVPLLRQTCEHVTVQGPDGLLPLLRRMPAIDHVIPWDTPSSHDSEIECSDLPHLFRTTEASIPPETQVRMPSGYPVPSAQQLSAASPDRKVGIAWAAGVWNPSRSLPFPLLLPLTEVPGITWFSLQRATDDASVLTSLPPGFINLETGPRDILATAAAIRQLDLIVSVDTMVAHLAATLGRPVWLLLRHNADWRWMLDRANSPWYRSMRIYRQTRENDWGTLIDRLHCDLANTSPNPVKCRE